MGGKKEIYWDVRFFHRAIQLLLLLLFLYYTRMAAKQYRYTQEIHKHNTRNKPL